MMDLRNISSLHNWKDNPRKIDKKDFERLKKQIQKLGQYKPLLVTKDGEVIGGNMRLKAYQELGITDIWVSEVNPKDENEKLEYALSDNDRAGYYDDDMLANLIPNYDIDWSQYAVDMKPPEDIQQLINKIAPVEEDEAPEIAEGEPVSKLGEVYQLGRHRLMCGDSTKIEDVEKLMDGKKADMVFTDPPYGIELDTDTEKVLGKNAKAKVYDRIIGDGIQFNAKPIFDMFGYCSEILIWGADYFIDTIPNCGKDGNFIVWDKRVTGNEDKKNYASEFELCWSKNKRAKRIYKHDWVRFFGMQNEDSKVRLHPNQKPTKLLCEIMPEGKSVVDLFGGSGSTLIACEQTNRICYMMELDPKYIDVIRKRYAKFIGKEDIWEAITPPIQ